jgi:hypothetical protein
MGEHSEARALCSAVGKNKQSLTNSCLMSEFDSCLSTGTFFANKNRYIFHSICCLVYKDYAMTINIILKVLSNEN